MLPQGMKREYYEGQVRMYEGMTGKKFYADIYDKMMVPEKSKVVQMKSWKGENPDRRNNWIKGTKSY